ncbi:MAG: hypothetical protein ACRC61_08585 [Aeromonas salmonicida]
MTNQKAIADLHSYFENIFPEHMLRQANESQPIVPSLSPSGAVQYQTYQFNEAPPKLQKQVEVGRVLMERFVAVASAAVNAKSPSEAGKYDFKTWHEVTRKIVNAFFTDPIEGNRHLYTEVAGVEIAKSVINFAGSVIAGNVAGFASFLANFGEGLSAEMKKTTASYNYLYAYSTHDLFQDQSGNVFYKPNFLVYGTHFSQDQKSIATSCGSVSKVVLDFGVNTVGGTFRIQQYMQDANFKKQVDDFLAKYEAKNIEDTDSYFDDIFNDVKPDSKTYVYLPDAVLM